MLNLILFSFWGYFLLSVSYFEELRGRQRQVFLFVICMLFAMIIGSRDPILWSDSAAYYDEFLNNTKTLEELSVSDGPINYSEMGFYYLGVISKTLNGSSVFYFTFISALSFLFLFLSFKRYGILPFIGLYVYLGRFVCRNTVQIRAALAIAIVIWGTIYVTKQQLWKYLLVVFVASRFHTSALLAIPLYFMMYVNIKKVHIYWGIAVALLIAAFWGDTIRNMVTTSEIANEWARSYIEEGSEKAYSNDLSNPMIWYQIVILFIMTFFESSLSKITEHYYTIRNAYFYSTVILIVLCQYAILAGRTSTIFATYEMFMIPMFAYLFKDKSRVFAYMGIGIVYGLIFYLNIKDYY